MEDIDPENLPTFQMPPSIIQKLYEFTGSTQETSKGFVLAYADQDGAPMILSKAGSQIVDMGIRKALEKYLIQIEEVDMPFDINDKDNS
jgi:hypothetical protein